MARARTARHPSLVSPPEPEDVSQEEPETPTGDNHPSNHDITKADMVRAALADGMEKPQEGVDWIKAHYGVELGKPMWSSYVAQQKARDRKAAGEDSTPRTRTAAPAQPGGIPATFGQDVKTIKQLVEQLGGGEAVKDMANTIADLTQKYGQQGLDSLIDAFE